MNSMGKEAQCCPNSGTIMVRSVVYHQNNGLAWIDLHQQLFKEFYEILAVFALNQQTAHIIAE